MDLRIIAELVVTLALVLFAYFAKDHETRSFIINVVGPYWFLRGLDKAKDKAKAQTDEDPANESES